VPKKQAHPKKTSSKRPTPRSPSNGGRLHGKIALVTGGSRGLGLAFASALAAEGCSVVITGRDEASLSSAAGTIGRSGGEVLTRHCDVRDPKSVAALFTALKAQFGHIDILVNNAGIAHPLVNVQDFLLETWREVIDTNLTGLFLLTHAALPLMKSGATIVNNLSVAAKTVFPGMSAYNASKHGALGFTDSLREELRPRGIRVIALMPGATDTGIWEQFWPEAPRARMMSPASIAEALIAAILLPDNATVTELVITPTGGAL
jgi:NAD(P)-dependent dehydrogenase (short-subunit alcohol dehydrogenase family)